MVDSQASTSPLTFTYAAKLCNWHTNLTLCHLAASFVFVVVHGDSGVQLTSYIMQSLKTLSYST